MSSECQAVLVTQAPDSASEWRKLTFTTYIQVTDRTAVAAAAFDRIIDPETGEESMDSWEGFPPDTQLESFLSSVLHNALDQVGVRAGFTSRWTWIAQLEPMDPPASTSPQ
jgi:hypothetical protein